MRRVESKDIDAKRAAGYVVRQLEETGKTLEELIKSAQERTPEGLKGTRYANVPIRPEVDCPALERLVKQGKVVKEKGSDRRWRYRRPPRTSD